MDNITIAVVNGDVQLIINDDDLSATLQTSALRLEGVQDALGTFLDSDEGKRLKQAEQRRNIDVLREILPVPEEDIEPSERESGVYSCAECGTTRHIGTWVEVADEGEAGLPSNAVEGSWFEMETSRHDGWALFCDECSDKQLLHEHVETILENEVVKERVQQVVGSDPNKSEQEFGEFLHQLIDTDPQARGDLFELVEAVNQYENQ